VPKAHGELVADDDAASVLDLMEHEQEVERVTAAVGLLPERLQAVVRARMEGRTLAEVGQTFDEPRSRERVRQVEAEAFAMLRRELRSA
jgi:DNA-directed RNA polymerase sigma subunit (sigma70/sigma32)